MTRKIQRPAWSDPAAIADLLRLSIPVAFSRMAVPIMSATDVIILGRMDHLQLPYVANAYLLIGIGLAISMGVLQGVQVFTAELSAVGQAHNTGRVLRRGLYVSLALGAFFTALTYYSADPLYHSLGFSEEVASGTASAARILALGLAPQMVLVGCSYYLEALRRPGLVTIIMYAGVLVNLVIDLALVSGWWGFDPMGADGVAWATTGSRVALVGVFLVIIWSMTPGFRASAPAPKGESMRQNTVGAGGAIANAAEFSGFNLSYVLATQISVYVASLYALAIQPIFLSFMLFMGVGTATSVRVAEAFARRDMVGVRDASRLGVMACIIVGAVIALAMLIFRTPLANFMLTESADGESAGMVAALAAVLGVASLCIVVDGLQGVSAMALRAQEVVWLPAVIQFGSYFAVMLPCVYVFGAKMEWGAMGVIGAVAFASTVAAVLQTVLLELKTARSLKVARR